MTNTEALTFSSHSAKNAEILSTACPKCEPYKDWFTFKRWVAQGLHIRRGEHGLRIGVIVEKSTDRKDPKAEVSQAFRTVPVFCRCQLA